MPTIELSIDEVLKLRSALNFYSVAKDLFANFENNELAGVRDKVNVIATNHENLIKREKAEYSAREFLSGDQEGLVRVLNELDRLYPVLGEMRH
jgi:hypothetical protein